MSATGFANIRTIKTDGYEGYQVTLLSQSSGFVSARKPNALQQALKDRNELYRECATLNAASMRRYAEGSIVETFDNNGDGKRVPCWRIQVRNLETSKPAQRFFRFENAAKNKRSTAKSKKDSFRQTAKKRQPPTSRNKALKQANALLKANLKAYNEMIDAFNELALEEGLKLARREARTLKPQLQKLDRVKFWKKVFKASFPDGLGNPVDPRSVPVDG